MAIPDSHPPLVNTPRFQEFDVRIPDTAGDFFQAGAFPGTDGGNRNPVRIPANGAVGAEAAGRETAGIDEGGIVAGMGRNDGT
jgi:hypothetical protein